MILDGFFVAFKGGLKMQDGKTTAKKTLYQKSTPDLLRGELHDENGLIESHGVQL